MSDKYENIPPERKNAFLENAEAEAREAAVRYLGQEAIAEAIMITEQHDLHEHFMETMAAAKGGVRGLAIAGRATSDDLVWEVNRRAAKGAEPNQVLEELNKAIRLSAKDELIHRGFMSAEGVANYANELLANGMDPELVQISIRRAQIAQMPKSPPSKPIF